MHKEPTQSPQRKHRTRSTQPLTLNNLDQYGYLHSQPQAFSVLLALPSESLTHVTSFLDPHSLLALAQVNKHLHEHVKDENTWHRAFVFQFLGVGAEGDTNGTESLMVRRMESTWRKEYIIRWNLRRQWQRSRSPTITHIPHQSHIASMHLMSESALLTSSLLYGVVSRSVPLTGKILKGFLDAAGSQHGLGIGNPNAEFSPNVSACALTSEGATAHVLWGFRSGEVATTTAPRAMETAVRSAANLVRCTVQDQHEVEVTEVAWSDGHMVCVSGDREGVVKLWEPKTMRCLWTSNKKQGVLIPAACTKVAVDITNGIVAAGTQDGEIAVWLGFSNLADRATLPSIREMRFKPHATSEQPNISAPGRSMAVTALFIEASISHMRILVAYEHHALFYRFEMQPDPNSVDRTAFGDESSGALRSVLPCFATRLGERSFVVAGDQLGGVSVYDWNALARSPNPISPMRRIEAHEDGAVTALSANATVFVTGSECGATKIWDALTLVNLKTHVAPGLPRGSTAFASVKQIALTKDMMAVAVGSSVLAWKAGPVNSRAGKTIMNSPKSARKREGVAKGHTQYEIKRAIKESSRVLEYEQAHTRVVYGREREHRSALESLGLNEVEAVEYALMLSRDEEEQRRLDYATEGSRVTQDEGVFEADFDDANFPTPVVEQGDISWAVSDVLASPAGSSASRPSPPPASRSPSAASSLSEPSRALVSHSLPWNVSHSRIHVSPRTRPEPTEAGFGPSPISLSPPAPLPRGDDEQHFPPMSRTPSSLGASSPGTPAAGGGIRRSLSGSPEWSRIAQSGQDAGISSPGTPGTSYSSAAARAPNVSPASSRQRRGAWAAAPPLAQTRSEPMAASGPSLLSTSLASGAGNTLPPQDEDEELRFAIELSLAEAKSREENV